MNTWNTDAQFAKEIHSEYIFTNQRIESFLNNYDQFLIVAAKGMGKTLLMRYKRALVENDDPSIILIPRNETSDYVTLPASPGKELVTAMHDSKFWEDIWTLAISISALLHFPHRISENEKKTIIQELTRTALPEHVQDDLKAAFSQTFHRERFPSSVLDILLQEGKRSIENMRATSLQIIHDLFVKYISSACFLFIDSFEGTDICAVTTSITLTFIN